MIKKNNNLIKLIIYIALLLTIIILSRITEDKNTKTKQENEKVNNKIINKIKLIDPLYYKESIHLILDDDAISLEYEKNNEIEMGIKKYHKIKTEYTKYNSNYYSFNNGEFIKLNNFIDFDYDQTFTKIENIKRLLETTFINTKTYKQNNQQIIKNTYNNEDIIEIYNEYNNTTYSYIKGESFLEIYSTNEKIDYLIINITSLYNEINKTDYKIVEYKIEIKEKKKEDNDWLIEKLN